MINSPFLAQRTLGEFLKIFDENKQNVKKTEHVMGIKRGKLDNKIHTRRFGKTRKVKGSENGDNGQSG